ncbi:heme ABC transporter ATP-binding protein [Aeromicrobium phragmitis]|uniref:Heme ABC transporter ATP-binding protein n=1 Tax=Aeromicrobium phragmitis TaxID=2478914 RepID=A0A3L8PHE7_9ACTN|nr:heme ABC transporter ATP-binding protein [Aeromicrobium phragmitis]RLV54726.1 heme ABC transporter ATP-binding protein [Aeromicrobium phragmitis]
MSDVVYRVRDLVVRRGERRLLDGVDLDVPAGEMLAIVGPNGAGKSTLVGVLAGDVHPDHGRVELEGREVAQWRPRELAQRRSVLLQSHAVSFGYTVDEIIAMGRSPWPADSQRDAAVIDHAVRRADVAHLRDRSYLVLSGGERARVSLARVLAQDTPILLLDEPTAALDLRHQEDVLRCAAEDARAGRTVIVVLHDLSLAAAYASRIVMLDRGRVAAQGRPRDVLTPERVRTVYGIDIALLTGPDGSLLVVPDRRPTPERNR